MEIIKKSTEVDQDDIKALASKGIEIWGVAQESLENQALKELEIFVEENKTKQQSTLDQTTVGNLAFYESNLEHNFSKNVVNNKSLSDDEISPEDSDYIPDEVEGTDDDYQPDPIKYIKIHKKSKKRQRQRAKKKGITSSDDALDKNYKARLDLYYKRLETEMQSLAVQTNKNKKDYIKLKGGLKVPKDVWEKLYEYQKEAVYWLWELYQRLTGGLLGDEMGLGKTVETIVFLHGLQYSSIISKYGHFTGLGPSIIVCPATIIHQWVEQFHVWAPEFRIVILHQSGTFQGYMPNLITKAHKEKCILVTTYAGILKYKAHICEYHWHYLILDEGHKIRNPAAKVTVAIKEIRTPYRILLTGSPMQNNLTELWSLFDFTNPGMLGNLQIFTEYFANPILHGGFTNATPIQEATALSVASTLKNVISPFLLRRMKSEVRDDIHLPYKSEQVLFCSLTEQQRDLYKDYLMSEQVNNILGRGVKQWRSDNFLRANMLMAITALRKICNHPDLFLNDDRPNEDSNYKNSGKMVVVSALLKIWKKQGHRTLLFSQGRAMLNIFERFLDNHGYKYLKMDGATNISSRHSMIEKFNQNPSYDVFLLTTRVGGLGVNLTGANRVIIYDPDWNPATDMQARERAWRIGQEKSVTIYRLVCAGTVEEKMYQRFI
ncbi:DNA excision repair protein ERCC-6-like isoform X2 [Anthonomus grandis grandis]|uniref:DNA excision repair protein ERCC-6-like isoform X2 n=1 Tax=Anthonomus grandis grandis TaxID=2921223 RepID=UPI0021667A08|nr:DNA excision repair protein ERCC-6-like isoform X2 [Anthonomus grandis grandis]